VPTPCQSHPRPSDEWCGNEIQPGRPCKNTAAILHNIDLDSNTAVKSAAAFVTEVLLNIDPSVTRLSLSCYVGTL
jgi:hypothetical protein